MKTVLLHGLGQTAQDWKEVVQQLSISDVDCPELFSSAEDEISYSQILGDLEQRYSEVKEPLRILICPLSSRQVRYLKVSDKNTYISFWSVGIFMHTISLYIF